MIMMVREQEIRAQGREEGREEGRQAGMMEILIRLVRNGVLSVSSAAEQACMSVSDFQAMMDGHKA